MVLLMPDMVAEKPSGVKENKLEKSGCTPGKPEADNSDAFRVVCNWFAVEIGKGTYAEES